jgi:hypothetical protein
VFKYYLNGTEIQDGPDKWDAIDTSIKRDELTGILLYDSNMRFTTYGGQDLYIALDSAWNVNRFGESTFDIYQRSGSIGYVLVHAGTIFHSDIEFNLINRSINFRTEDRGYYAMINNNKSIEVNLDQSSSKNEVTIGVCPSFMLDMHKVSDGTIYPDQRVAYRIYDVLEWLIRFMSDDRIGFESETFGTGGIYDGYCIVAGHEMIEADGTISPRVSWGKLSEDLQKRFNVRFAIIGTMDRPILKCESYERFYTGDVSYTIPTIPDEVVMKIDTNVIYSGVNVGSEDYETTSSLTFPDVQYLISFKTENLYFKGTNNIDRTLDLVGSYVISNSSIEVVLEQLSGYENYDDKQFIIHYDTATDTTIDTNWTATSGHLYNEPLTNINILSRWAIAFPNEVTANFFDPDANRFKAVRTSSLSSYIQTVNDDDLDNNNGLESFTIQFNDDYTDGYDPGTNYGDTTPQGTPVGQTASFYTAPIGGLYNFSAVLNMKIQQYSTAFTLIGKRKKNWRIRFIKSTGEIFDCSTFETPKEEGQYNFTLSGSCVTYMNTADTMEVRMFLDIENANTYSAERWVQWAFDTGSYFMSNGIDIGGGTLTPADPEQYKSVKIKCSYPITLADYFTIRESKEGLIKVPISSTKAINGWVENIKFDHSSGEATFELVSDGNTIYR